MNNHLFSPKEIVVIKTGSALIVDKNNKINSKWIHSLVEDILLLQQQGIKVLLVSSGSIVLGKEIMGISHEDKSLSLSIKQACSACGQIVLMSEMKKIFNDFNLDIAQILFTNYDSEEEYSRFINIQNTVIPLINNNIIPIINENDTTSTDEIRYGDNDRLAARFAQIVQANKLILLSDIDGIYDKNPNIYDDAKHIKEIHKIDNKIIEGAGNAVSNYGSGGMYTKVLAAKMANNIGCDMIIAKGNILNPIKNIIDNNSRYSIFYADKKSKENRERKNWILNNLNNQGVIILNIKLNEAIDIQYKHILKIDKTRFDAGNVCDIYSKDNKLIGKAIVNYSSHELLNHKFIEEEIIIYKKDLVLMDLISNLL